MKRFSAAATHYPDPSKPPEGGEDDSFSSDGSSKKVKTTQSFESLFDNESLSDVILNINNGQFIFHAHRMILGLKSDVLSVMINGLPSAVNGKQVLHLQEPFDCSLIFSRFLYFIYSGAVWLHRDYVLPLYKLADKYSVKSLAMHCENYIFHIINNAFVSGDYSRAFSIETICDLHESSTESEDIKNVTFKVLCSRFQDLTQSERWRECSWQLVRELIKSNECQAEENTVLSAATEWMKQNNLNDKSQIEDILTHIRYPLLNRRVLYHLQKNSAFKNFPRVQELVMDAIKYHCFKDLPEARDDFTDIQYQPRLDYVLPLITNGHGGLHSYSDLQTSQWNGEMLSSVENSSSLAQRIDHT